MDHWRKVLTFDPLQPLLAQDNAALQYFARRDLLTEEVASPQHLWLLPAAQKILRQQLPDGSWPRRGELKHAAVNYRLIETWRYFGYLVEQYGFTREHPKAKQAAEFLFSCQTGEGDFRGFLANQYATYYSGAIMALLIQAGYADDPRIANGFEWLLAMRQEDGGWTIPILTHKLDRATMYRLTSQYAEPLQPNRAKPCSHNWTGMVLRAFAVHPHYRNSEAARTAAELLKARFFQPDRYTSYQSASYWIRFGYPFWWNNLLTAMDSLSRIGVPREDAQIQLALQWFIDHQEATGLWKVSYARAGEQEKDTLKTREIKLWVSLAICRIFKRYFD